MAYRTLVTTDVLAARLDDPAWIVVDCRFRLDNVSWGEQAYAAGHIPGAAYAHLDRDLSGPKTGANGRHPLPDPQALRNSFGRLGITSHTQVVAYDQDSGMYAEPPLVAAALAAARRGSGARRRLQEVVGRGTRGEVRHRGAGAVCVPR